MAKITTQAADLAKAQDEISQGNKDVRIENGQIYVWQPTNVPQDAYSYQNVDPLTGQPRTFDPNGPTWGPDEGPGTWVPATYTNPNGQLGSVLGKMALYTSGGELALGAAGLGGAAAAGGAGSGASAAAPAMANVVAPGSLATGGTTIGAGGLLAPSATGAGLMASTAPAMANVVAPGSLATGGTTIGAGGLTAPAAMHAGLTGAATKDLLSAGGRALSGAANAAANNRSVTDDQNLRRDQLSTTIAQDAAADAMDRERTLEGAQTDAYKKALLAALAQNMGDFSVDTSQFQGKIPHLTLSGGPRPSALGSEGQAAASTLYNQAMQRLLADPNTLVPAYQPPTLSPPTPAGAGEKIAGPLGLGLTALAAYYGSR